VLKTSPFHIDDEKINQLSAEGLSVERPVEPFTYYAEFCIHQWTVHQLLKIEVLTPFPKASLKLRKIDVLKWRSG